MVNRSIATSLVSIVSGSLAMTVSLWYVYLNQAFDETTLLAGVIIPLSVGSLIFAATRQRMLLFAFLAYFWSLVEDGPVYFDSIFTWPEVTRFHPAEPHIFMEVILHALTLFFLYLAIREALKGTTLTRGSIFKVSLLTLVAFVLSYAQNIPLDAIQSFVDSNWYDLDVAEHVASVIFLYLAIREAAKDRRV